MSGPYPNDGKHKQCAYCGRNTEEEPEMTHRPISIDDLPAGNRWRLVRTRRVHDAKDGYQMFSSNELWVCTGCIELNDLET